MVRKAEDETREEDKEETQVAIEVDFSIDEELVHKVLDQYPWVSRVIDPFCGAGTIVKVARERGLEAYGLDIDPDAVKVAQEQVA